MSALINRRIPPEKSPRGEGIPFRGRQISVRGALLSTSGFLAPTGTRFCSRYQSGWEAIMEEVLYHGTDGDSILSILTTGELRPNDQGEIYFSQWEWPPALMHGNDSKRKAHFVIQVRVQIPKTAGRLLKSTPGVRNTVVIQTGIPIKAQVLELYIRRPTPEGFSVCEVKGSEAIRAALAQWA